jgi:3-methyladenine DNA glycosylase AlkD
MKEDILLALRNELRELSDQKAIGQSQRYFKEPITCYGVKTATVGKLGKQYLSELKNLSKNEVFALCDSLFKADYCEEAFIACDWVYSRYREYQPEDFQVFENWINKYINNWAKCDTLCNHSMAAFIDMYPEYLMNLKEWAKSENRWVKRAAAVSLIIPAKQGRYLKDIFEISDILLMDQDDLVQKGYGWMLKAASQAHQTEVFEYVMRNKTRMPRTALRYAIEKMSLELKKQAMER